VREGWLDAARSRALHRRRRHQTRVDARWRCRYAHYIIITIVIHFLVITYLQNNIGSAPPDAEFLSTYFGTLSVDDTLEILKDMLRTNMRGNLQTVVQVRYCFSFVLLSSF
jgi:hypothetical protein